MYYFSKLEKTTTLHYSDLFTAYMQENIHFSESLGRSHLINIDPVVKLFVENKDGLDIASDERKMVIFSIR